MRGLLIGYGNPLRGDDGIGWKVVERAREIYDCKYIETHTCHQLTPELAERIGRFPLVLFIDASLRQSPGRYTIRPVDPREGDDGLYSHACSPAALLAYSERLYGTTPRCYLIEIGGYRFDFTSEISRELNELIPEIHATIRRVIESSA